jgi:hypothetical protein
MKETFANGDKAKGFDREAEIKTLLAKIGELVDERPVEASTGGARPPHAQSVAAMSMARYQPYARRRMLLSLRGTQHWSINTHSLTPLTERLPARGEVATA